MFRKAALFSDHFTVVKKVDCFVLSKLARPH